MKRNKQTTIQTLLALGKGQREIARITGIDRKTVRRYQEQLAAANSPGVATGSAQQPGEQNPPPRPPAHTSACEPWREFIEAQLLLKRNAVSIYQDLVDAHGFTHAYNSVKRFVGQLRWREPEQFDRLEFVPGEEAQVDYGEGALTFDPISQRWKRPRLFVMTLRYSRRSFRRVVWKSSQQEWARLHEQAFRYFGGATRYVVLDNLKEGVIKPDLYEPELNPVYAALLVHYHCVADPARVRDPNRKGTVESAIQHTQSTALKGRRFVSVQPWHLELTRAALHHGVHAERDGGDQKVDGAPPCPLGRCQRLGRLHYPAHCRTPAAARSARLVGRLRRVAASNGAAAPRCGCSSASAIASARP